MTMVGREVRIVLFNRREETYVFVFEMLQIVEARRQVGRMAADPGLSFSWHDAALVVKQIREIETEWKASKASRLPSVF